MTYVKITPPPGVYTEVPQYTAEGRWVSTEKVRFRYEFPEKIGGWAKAATTSTTGVPRNIHTWRELDGIKNIALADEYFLYINQGGTQYELTPLRTSGVSLGSNPLTMTSSSPTVTVAHTSHGITVVGCKAIIAGASAAHGITVTGTYIVQSIPDANSFTITHTSNASSSGTGGGGSVTASYTLNVVESNAIFGYGFGSSTYNSSTWGTARSTSNVTLDLAYWSLGNWGEDLVATPRNGVPYAWDSSAGTSSRAAAISGAPSQVGLTLVSTPDRHLIALGAHDGSTYDPMLIRWSDQEDYTTWTAAAANTAGSQRLGRGNKIIAAEQSRNTILVWTDEELHAMQYIGPPYTFGFQPIATGCGAIGVNAVVTHENGAFWMGQNNFWMLDGQPGIISCPILNHVFDDLNSMQADKIYAGINAEFDEVWWHYPTADSTENDAYIVYNYKDKIWYFGTMGRTTWLDRGTYGYPLATNSAGELFYHEYTTNSDGIGFSAYCETGAFEPGEGEHMSFLDKIIPDSTLGDNGSLSVTVYTRRYPNSSDITKGTYTTNNSTEKVSLRARGRQYRFRFEANDADNAWKLGTWRANIQADGKR